MVCGRRLEPLEETVSLCDDGRCSAVTCDIRDEDEVEALVEGVIAEHDKIDLLLNNAGGQYMAPAESISPKGFRTVVRLNVEGTSAMCHAVATKVMVPRGRGTIVNVTLSPHHGLAGMAHSSSARAAVEGLTKQLAAEWGPSGVNVIALAAGHFSTETLRTKYPKVIVDGVAKTVPLQRLGHRAGVRLDGGAAGLAGRRGAVGLGAHHRRCARQQLRALAAAREPPTRGAPRRRRSGGG